MRETKHSNSDGRAALRGDVATTSASAGAAASAIMDRRTQGAAARNLAETVLTGPRMTTQRLALRSWSAAAQRRPAVRPGPQAGASVAQLVELPKDSVGSIDRVMAAVGEGANVTELTGADLQGEILWRARRAGEETGYRLGSYYLLSDDRQSLVRKKYSDDEPHGMSPLPDKFDVAGLDEYVHPYIYGTLSDAGQLEYIKKNADAIYATHDVVIDVDCQFDRRGKVGFHKDSRGTTLFVNLTFSNDAPMLGAENYEDVKGDPGLEAKLPEVVKADIKARREAYGAGEARIIRAPTLPAHGRQSSSDPNVYHSTPLMGHRMKRTGEETKAQLISDLCRVEGLSLNLAKDALPKYYETSVLRSWWKFYSNLLLPLQGNESREHLISGLCKVPQFVKLVAKEQLREKKLRVLQNWWDIAMNPYIRHAFEKNSSVADHDEEMTLATARRKRALSVSLDKNKITPENLKEQAETPRTFIRTWVRFVPRG